MDSQGPFICSALAWTHTVQCTWSSKPGGIEAASGDQAIIDLGVNRDKSRGEASGLSGPDCEGDDGEDEAGLKGTQE